MEKIVIVVHVLAALSIIGLILLQQGKGAAMGASFGSGASQTVFGSTGSGSFFSRMTGIISVVFFATSFGLAVIAKDKAAVSDSIGIPTLETELPIVDEAPESDIPVINQEATDSGIPSVDSDVPAETAPAQ